MPPPGDAANLSALAREAGQAAAAASLSPPVSYDTSYVAVVDRHGNAFSATPSDPCFNMPVVPGTGLLRLARIAIMGGPRPSFGRGPRQTAATDTQPRAGHPRRRVRHAIRDPRRRRAVTGHAADVHQHGRLRHGPAVGGGGSAVRDVQLPGFVRAARLHSRPTSISKAESRAMSAMRCRCSGTTSSGGPTGSGAPALCASSIAISSGVFTSVAQTPAGQATPSDGRSGPVGHGVGERGRCRRAFAPSNRLNLVGGLAEHAIFCGCVRGRARWGDPMVAAPRCGRALEAVPCRSAGRF